MPKNKDLKRLVRSRMQKTGEAYTTARRHVLGKHRPRTTAPTTRVVDHAALAGMRDDAVLAKTGRTWQQWCELLDAAGAAAKTHTEIARELRERHGVSPWWSQTVTGGYERIRGRRVKNQRPDGFGVGKSRTFALPVAQLRSALAPAARRRWLGGPDGTARRSSNADVVRWRLGDGSFVDVRLVPKTPGKTTVVVEHSRLASAEDVERWRAAWGERLAALARWLAGPDGG